MKKEYSRRDFLKLLGTGTATVALGATLTSCKEGEEEKIALNRLGEYHVFKQHQTDRDYDEYIFIKEQRYLDSYMYLDLNVTENKYFYDNVYITLKDENEYIDLDNGVEHINFRPLLNEFDMIDIGNAIDVVSSIYGIKEFYSASDINNVPDVLRNKKETKKLVKKR